MTTDIAVHDKPSWRDDANFLIFSDLSDFGLEDRWEQLWARQVNEDEFVLCCIPFFTYGMALGDRLRTAPRKGRNYVVSTVVARGGHRVLRLWLKRSTREGRSSVDKCLAACALLHEWKSENLVAIDVVGHSDVPAALADLLASIGDLSIDAEWG